VWILCACSIIVSTTKSITCNTELLEPGYWLWNNTLILRANKNNELMRSKSSCVLLHSLPILLLNGADLEHHRPTNTSHLTLKITTRNRAYWKHQMTKWQNGTKDKSQNYNIFPFQWNLHLLPKLFSRLIPTNKRNIYNHKFAVTDLSVIWLDSSLSVNRARFETPRIHDEIHEVLKWLPLLTALVNSEKSGGGLVLIQANLTAV